MLSLALSANRTLNLATLVLDYNGTIARDGVLLDGIAQRLTELAKDMRVVVLSADTHGTVRYMLRDLPVTVMIIDSAQHATEGHAKLHMLEELGADTCAAMGNGRNDALMLQRAALSVAIIGEEGASMAALTAAQVAVRDIRDGLDLLHTPQRLRATLRD